MPPARQAHPLCRYVFCHIWPRGHTLHTGPRYQDGGGQTCATRIRSRPRDYRTVKAWIFNAEIRRYASASWTRGPARPFFDNLSAVGQAYLLGHEATPCLPLWQRFPFIVIDYHGSGDLVLLRPELGQWGRPVLTDLRFSFQTGTLGARDYPA